MIKTFTLQADRIIYDKVELWMGEDAMLHVRRPYRFVDVNGAEMKLQSGMYEENFEWSTVPADVQKALTFIDNYTKGKINTKEGI